MSFVTRKRVSKKNKASWRKHVDIKDVEDFLENQRTEERIGNILDKSNDELFIDDKESKVELLSNKIKRKENAKKPPRGFIALENTSDVKDPIKKRNHTKILRTGKNVITKILNNESSRKVLQSIQDRVKYCNKFRNQNKAKIFKNDLWEVEDTKNHEELNNEWIDKSLGLYHLRNTGKPIVKIDDRLRKKPNKLKPIETPHPGTSYNPSFNDYQDLLNIAIEKEAQIIKEEKHLKRVTTDMFSKIPEEERNTFGKEEIVEENEKEVNEVNTDPYNAVNPPTKIKKKDKKSRRKQREQKEFSFKRMKMKLEKKKITDIHRIKHICNDLKEEHGKLIQQRKQKIKKNIEKKFQTGRLGKRQYKDPEIDLCMIKDLSGNLRNTKPNSNLILSSFKRLEKRNILPVTADAGKRKHGKIKAFFKNSHKDDAELLRSRV